VKVFEYHEGKIATTKYFHPYVVNDQNVVTNNEAVIGSTQFCLLFSVLLKGMLQLSGVLLLNM
jgi:hypothetical protein